MARINKQEVLQEMQEGLRLDTAREKTPQELADKILPTYQVNPRPRLIMIRDTLVNDSNKTLTVPTGKIWKLLYGVATLIASATVGNRRIEFRLLDTGSSPIYLIQALNVQIANATERYNIGQFSDVLETVAGVHMLPIPNNVLIPEDFSIQFLDNASIDVAADDLQIRFIVEESDMNPNR